MAQSLIIPGTTVPIKSTIRPAVSDRPSPLGVEKIDLEPSFEFFKGGKIDFDAAELEPAAEIDQPEPIDPALGPIFIPPALGQFGRSLSIGAVEGGFQRAAKKAYVFNPTLRRNDQGELIRNEKGRAILDDFDILSPEQRVTAAIEFSQIYNKNVKAQEEAPFFYKMAEEAASKGTVDGFVEMLVAMNADPGNVLAHAAGEQLGRSPTNAIVGFIPVIGTYIATFDAEKMSRMASGITDAILESGGDPDNPEHVYVAFGNKELLNAIAIKADIAAQATAQAETFVEVLTFAASQKFMPKGVGMKLFKALGIFSSEFLGEGTGELAGQAALKEDLNLVSAIFAGLLATGQNVTTTIGTMGVQQALKSVREVKTSGPKAWKEVTDLLDTWNKLGTNVPEDEVLEMILHPPGTFPDLETEIAKSSKAQAQFDQVYGRAQAFKQQQFMQGFGFFSEDQDEDATGQPIGSEELIQKVEDAKAALPPMDEEQLVYLTQARQDAINLARQAMTLDALPTPKRKAWNKAIATAYKKGIHNQAMEFAVKIMANEDFTLTEEIQAGMAMGAAILEAEFGDNMAKAKELKDADKALDAESYLERATFLRRQADAITRAIFEGRTETARTLAAGNALLFSDPYSLRKVLGDAELFKGGQLTKEETFSLTEEVDEYGKAIDDVIEGERVDQLSRAEIMRQAAVIQAENRVARLKKEGELAEDEVVSDERKAKIDKNISVLKARLNDLGFRTNDVIGMTTEGLAIVSQMALEYMKKGLINVQDLVRQLRKDVPTLTEDEAHEAIMDLSDDAAAQVQKDIQKKKGIVDEGQGILDSLAELSITDPVAARKATQRMKEIARDTFQTDEQKLEKIMREIRRYEKKLPPESVVEPPKPGKKKTKKQESLDLRKAQEQLRQLKRAFRLEQEAARLNDLADRGVPDERAKKKERLIPDLPQLKDAKIRLEIARRNLNRSITAHEPIQFGTFRDGYQELNAMFRLLMATADMSSIGRQGLPLTLTNPILASKAAANGVQSFFSQDKADLLNLALTEHPLYLQMLDLGVEFTSFGQGRTKLEETYQSGLIRKIPAFTELMDSDRNAKVKAALAPLGIAKEVIDASERIMVTHLNLLRFSVMEKFLADPGLSDQALKLAARYVNEATGRGTLKASTIKLLNNFLFAPRFTASRIQLPITTARMLAHPGLRLQAAKQFAGMLGLGTLVLGLGATAGLDVGQDPDDSDFGKLIFGNSRYDLYGGNQQLPSLITRIIRGGLDVRGAIEDSKARGVDPFKLIANFGWYKVAPLSSGLVELLGGKTLFGEEAELLKTARNRLVPLFLQDVIDAMEQDGWGAFGKVGIPAFFGIGVSTFGNELNTGDIKPILAAAEFTPTGPSVPEALRENTELKEDIKGMYAILMADKIRGNMADFKLLADTDDQSRKELKSFLQQMSAEVINNMKTAILGLGNPAAIEGELDSEEVKAMKEELMELVK